MRVVTGPGDQAAYTADYSNRDNGLNYTVNKKTAYGARASMKTDFELRPGARGKTEHDSVEGCRWAIAVPQKLKVHTKKADKDGDDD